ncbi:MAG TPA: hypothetical protein VGG83_11715 [Trebonia sp.]|jgi:hypothetical protein
MSSKRSNFLAAGAGVALVASVALASSTGVAHASVPSASVSLSVSTVTAGTDPALRYNVSDVPSGSAIYLEQSTNGGQAWKRVKHLATSHGAVHLQPSTAGTYNYKIVVQQGGTVVFSSGPTTLTVNNSSQSDNSWLNDVESFLGPILSDPVEAIAGWFDF